MKVVYCAKCGARLNIARKALPYYATIIDIVESHTCTETIAELDLTPVSIPVFNYDSNDKFVQKITDLSSKPSSFKKSTEPGDQRLPEHTKPQTTSAPSALFSQLLNNDPSEPAHSITEEDFEKLSDE